MRIEEMKNVDIRTVNPESLVDVLAENDKTWHFEKKI